MKQIICSIGAYNVKDLTDMLTASYAELAAASGLRAEILIATIAWILMVLFMIVYKLMK